MTSPTADRLLDAQVAWVLARLEDDLPTLVAEEVASLLAVGQRLTVGALVDADDVFALISDVLERVPPSTAASTFTAVLAEVLHAGPADGEEHTLGDVVSREHVEALTDAALAGTDTLKDALDDLTRSPAVAAVAGRFMARVVSEVVQTNRAMAEKLPGLGSLVSFGAGAAGKVIGATQVDALVGAAAGQGAGFAVRRLNAIVVDTLRDPGTRAAVLEVYGLYADQPLTGLQRAMTLEQAQHLAGLVQDVVIDAAPSAPVQALVRAVAEGFVATYADHPVSELVADLGVDAEAVTAHVTTLAARAITAAREAGELEPMVRSRLAPFWESPEVAALLGD
ncbi:hypothetical protein [uncultured Nocardioides sp.]|uniref:hypothetical protein n=1 Tax=uncultured Nocardioides sp. TaxID=198441 RepID=UPI000C58E236|nr:hypothetical protein [uncultured Nocardioides sp.]MAY95253.1 hypothetical protein [Nocardioides sp.]MCK5930220.1 hypothetical protein [Nocardioides sp.]